MLPLVICFFKDQSRALWGRLFGCGIRQEPYIECPLPFRLISRYGEIFYLYSLLDPHLWATWGITTLKHAITDGRVMSFAALKQVYSLPSYMMFRYLQLQHALTAKFPEPIVLESDPVECFFTSSVMGKPLSSLYLHLSAAHNVKLTLTYE